jgi:hypothetical protein
MLTCLSEDDDYYETRVCYEGRGDRVFNRGFTCVALGFVALGWTLVAAINQLHATLSSSGQLDQWSEIRRRLVGAAQATAALTASGDPAPCELLPPCVP